MAITTMTTTNDLTVKLWELQGFLDIIKPTAFGRMARRGSIKRAEKLDNAEAGDEMTVSFTGLLTGQGQTEGGTLVGNEEALDLQAFSMKYNVVRHAVSSPNTDTIEQARTLVPFYKNSREQLIKWHASRVDASVFNQLAGVNSTTITVDNSVYSGSARTIVQGLNTINSPTSNRIIRAAGAASDEALTSSNTFSLDLIDAAVEKLMGSYPTSGSLDNDEFDLYISYEQLTDLKRDTSGKIQWYAINLQELAGGNINNNPITVGNAYGMKPVGKYANVNIIPTFRVAYGQNSSTSAAISNVRRAVLVGANALYFASKFSGAIEKDFTPKQNNVNVPLKFFEQLKDYDYERGLEARMIYGVKKTQFDGEDFGSVVISTYAAPHTY